MGASGPVNYRLPPIGIELPPVVEPAVPGVAEPPLVDPPIIPAPGPIIRVIPAAFWQSEPAWHVPPAPPIMDIDIAFIAALFAMAACMLSAWLVPSSVAC